MTITATTNLSLPIITTGTESGTWGDVVDNGLTSYLDIAIAGGLSVSITTTDVTLTNTAGTSSATNISSTTAQYAILNISGIKTAARTLTLPASSKWYFINNVGTSGSGGPFALTVAASGRSGLFTLADGERAVVAFNGADYIKITPAITSTGANADITSLSGIVTLSHPAAGTPSPLAITGGASSTPGSAGGAVTIIGGVGTSTTAAGAGGAVTITGGAAGSNATSNGNGGTVNITGGAANSLAANTFPGGVILSAGAAQIAGQSGGSVTITATDGYNSTTTSNGGNVTITTGAANGTTPGTGGAVIIKNGSTEIARVLASGAISFGSSGTATGTSGQSLVSAGSGAAPTWSSATQIQPISASVASNALTISASALNLDFRSTTLGSGTVTTVSGTPANLVVGSGATLATVNAIQSRLVVLAINNAGTLELAVSNIAGGTNLTETGLISTNSITQTSSFTGSIAVTTGILTLSSTPTGTFAIGQALSGTNVNSGTYIVSLLTGSLGVSGSTYQTNQFTAAASTTMTGVAGMGVYSTTARTNVAYRVIGYIESTQTTAGTWATAPSTIQGEGGQALTAMSSLGYGQTWQSLAVGTARVFGTTYYNTTGRPITVAVTTPGYQYAVLTAFVNGVTLSNSNTSWSAGAASSAASLFVIVPPGASYSFTNSSAGSGPAGTGVWSELR